MGLFRRAKAKQKPVNQINGHNDNDDVIVRRRRSKSPFKPSEFEEKREEDDIGRYRRHSPCIREFSGSNGSTSVGDTLAEEDQFFLFVPNKRKEERRVLRDPNETGDIIFPSSRKSRTLEESSTVSSITSPSFVVLPSLGTTKGYTISMHLTKAKSRIRDAKTRKQKQNKLRSAMRKKMEVANYNVNDAQPPSELCCGTNMNRRSDIDQRVPQEKNGYHGKNTKYNGVQRASVSQMNSTIATGDPFANFNNFSKQKNGNMHKIHNNNKLSKYMADRGENTNKISTNPELREPPISEMTQPQTNTLWLLNSLCGPREVPPETLVLDDLVTPDVALGRGVSSKYENPDKSAAPTRIRSLFDTYSEEEDDDDDNEEHERLQTQEEICNDEAKTTAAVVQTEGSHLYESRDEYYSIDSDDDFEEEDSDCDAYLDEQNPGKSWKFKLPKSLPKVRNVKGLSRLRRLSRAMSFKSTNQSRASRGRSRDGSSRGQSHHSRGHSTSRQKSPRQSSRSRSKKSMHRKSSITKASSTRSNNREIDPVDMFASKRREHFDLYLRSLNNQR